MTDCYMVCELSNELAGDGLGVYIALFKNVKNTRQLLDKTLQETTTFVDASLVVSLEQVLIAINRSLYLRTHSKTRLNNFFAEILFNFSISKNISESLQLFGIDKLKDEESANILVITTDRLDTKPELFDEINGDMYSTNNAVFDVTKDNELVKKAYKTDNRSIIESKLACKSFLS